MSSEIIGTCWSCGHGLQASDYGRETNCLNCSRPTRVCLNCRWYAPERTNACEEPVAEPVMEKDRPNFCSFFEPATGNQAGSESKSAADHMAAAEDLFKL